MDGCPDCGDQLECWRDDERLAFCVVDGLGHGKLAKEAANEIVQYVAHHRFDTLGDLFRGCDDAMRHRRGGMMAVGWVDGDQLTYASVGNITGLLARHDDEHHHIEHLNMDRGLISGGFARLNVQQLILCHGDLLIVHSDGLNPFYRLTAWQPVLYDTEKLAQVLLEDQGKRTDDACVLVYRHEGARA